MMPVGLRPRSFKAVVAVIHAGVTIIGQLSADLYPRPSNYDPGLPHPFATGVAPPGTTVYRIRSYKVGHKAMDK